MNQFVNFLNTVGLIYMPSSGNEFTWCNNHDPSPRIYEKLDRAVVSASWLNKFPQAILNNLPIYQSDHGPICLSLDSIPMKIKRSFKFEAAWINEKSFKDIVSTASANAYVGNSIQKFNSFISSFQYLAKNWNTKIFGNLFIKKKLIHIT